MRRLLALPFLVAGLWLPATADASCAAGVEWRGVFYTVTGADGLEHGRALRGGVFPGCDDLIVAGPDGRRTNPPPPDMPADLVRLRGVSPAVALGVRDDADAAYLAPGYLPQLADHPLHRAVYRTEPRAGCRHRRTITRSGHLAFQPALGLRFLMRKGRAETDIRVDRDTEVSGRRRHGTAYFEGGDRVVVTGRRCGAHEIAATVIAIG
ncbi:MAG TPA: hypothetical protein VF533_19025 [Solirubrobacteraceae bacterium]|jgi:hypothetical protein